MTARDWYAVAAREGRAVIAGPPEDPVIWLTKPIRTADTYAVCWRNTLVIEVVDGDTPIRDIGIRRDLLASWETARDRLGVA